MKKLLLFLLFGILSHILHAQTVPIEFNVYMQYQIEKGNFDPENEFVDVAGSFNGWGSTLTPLSDEDGDSVYTVTLNGFDPGAYIEYKFRFNGQWDDREEFPGAGNNRSYTVKSDSNVISVWYNDEVLPSGPPKASFQTELDAYFVNSLVTFRNLSEGVITGYEWYFEGGSPGVSSEEEPVVRYSAPGSYDVQLIAYNDEVRDTLLISDYVTVRERDTENTQWWNDLVFYEIFVRSFYDSDGDGIGDFNGLTEKLDYLNDGDPSTDSDLGIGGIWLMPIHDSPSYHGYDVTDYRSINPDYGTMEDFQNFLDAAHERGIKVIIDLVLNHSSDRHPWFQRSAAGDPEYRDYYRWSDVHPGYDGPWGQNVWHERNGDFYYGVFWSGMPDLNYENPVVRDTMFSVSDFWIEEVGVDGFRLDAVLYLDEDDEVLENTPETFSFWNAFNTNLKNANPDAFSVGEAWEPTEIALDYMSDDRLDYVFEFDLASSIMGGVNTGNAENIVSTLQNVYDAYPFLQYGTFLTNHDMNRVMSVFSGDTDKAKAAASIYLTLPGIPYIYYGEEIGMLGQKPDEDIRLPMQWSADTYAGFSTTVPWRSPNSNYRSFNVEDMNQDPSSLLNHYRRLIHLRNELPDLRTGELEIGRSSHEGLISYVRGNPDGTHHLINVNLSSEDISGAESRFSDYFFSDFPSLVGWYGDIIYSDGMDGENEYEVEINSESGIQTVNNITIPAYGTEIVAFESLLTSTENGNDIPDRISLFQNYPNPFNPATTIRFELPASADVRLEVYDITGRKVAELFSGRLASGMHQYQFDASALASGIYIYRLQTPEMDIVKKMSLIK